MSDRKLVSRDAMNDFLLLLVTSLNDCQDIKYQNLFLNLIDVFEKTIIEKDREQINEIKRMVYRNMINEKDSDKNKELYEVYQQLKELYP